MLCENTMFQITTQVQEYIKDGWQPYGSPMMVNGAFGQAMVKYE